MMKFELNSDGLGSFVFVFVAGSFIWSITLYNIAELAMGK